MAALLESLLHSKVELSETVLWLKGQHVCESQDLLFKVSREEFVPFLLNFLREQSSQTLTHGPTTPAKTPSTSKPVRTSERRGNKSTPVQGLRSASRVQLFSPAPSTSPVGGESPFTSSHCLSGVSAFSSPSFSSVWSPAPHNSPSERRSAQRLSLGDFMTSPPEVQPGSSTQQHKGRRRSGGCASGRQTGARVAVSEEGGGRRCKGVARFEPVSPPTQVQLNFNNLEDFPPVGAAQSSPVATKPSRRINPTPVSAERPNCKPKSCFTSTPLSLPESVPESTGAKLPAASLQEERELLRKERSKLAQQTSSPLTTTPVICTPSKTVHRQGSKVTPDPQSPCPDPDKVTQKSELDLLAELYCTCISENLVPCVFLELFFMMQLLTSRGMTVCKSTEAGISVCEDSPEVLEKAYLGNVHNCVYFSVRVLENQFELVSHLDKCTLRLLSENERVVTFSSSLRDRLAQAQDNCTAKVLPSPPLFVHSVPFQAATDNRFNFCSDRGFHTFKKQRDVFYGLIREWEDSHNEPGWDFEAALGHRVRIMVSQLTAAGSHSHFARLLQKQLIQMCKSPCVLGSSSDAPDADLLGMLGADSLGRLKRLQQRLVQPQGLIGPCPPPSFPGHQEFFRGFLQTASCCQLNQHLKDGLCQQLLKLDEVSILGPDASPARGEETGDGDIEQQDEKQRFSSVLLTARLLAKFLGFISFLPYQTSELPSRDIQDAAVTLRSKSSPVLDVCAVLRNSVYRRRTILTVPWMVEFLSMLDYIGPFLPCYRTALCLLLQIYKRLVLGREGELCYMNQLLMVAVLGWLFQIPIFPEDLFFSTDLKEEIKELENNTSCQGLDTLPLVDQQLLLTCCPYLGEFRKLLAAFVAGSTSKSGGLIRKITPTSAELRGPSTTRSQQKLQVDLEQAFFHNQPPSLRRTVEFVAERVGSNCVKHIKATLVLELVKGGEKTLRDSLGLEGVNTAKLNDSICAKLCDAGMQTLERATRFCVENAPGAVRVLLPLETSPSVLTTAESITTRLATEKACSWLSSNITTLLKREWKSAFERVIKKVPSAFNLDAEEGEGSSKSQPVQKSASGLSAGSSCVSDCNHKVPLGSEVIIEVKEVLSVSVGPRSEEEVYTVHQIESLLDRVGQTLGCRKHLAPVVEQMLLRCTVQMACKLVSGELPLVFSAEGNKRPALLERFLILWTRAPSPPLHLLYSEPTLTAIAGATDSERNDYLFLIGRLVERGLLGEEEVATNWPKLSALSWPEESVEKFQQLSLTTQSPVPSLPNHRDTLQVSQ
ncbi:codanin-1 [Siphateles boraxobius]|uniref:codanin-1 n=1 Tax=Siphateles boraxobius TaxID=180520 RepID=UPI0040648E30